MKALTIKQPWAWAILAGLKDIENRTWSTKFRGRVLVHAGLDKKLDEYPMNLVFNQDQLDEISKQYNEIELCSRLGPFGAIIGSVEIIDCVQNHPSIWAEKIENSPFDRESNPKKIYNFVLANPIKLKEPIKIKGKLNFWESNINICQICGQPTDLLKNENDEYFCQNHKR